MLRPISLHSWGEVHPIQAGERATHVWQHLYNPMERWDGLVGADIPALRHESERCGCPPLPEKPRARLRGEPPSCTELLERHHERYYGPAYLRELASEGTVHGRQKRDFQRLWCCTPRGVLVSVGLRYPRSVLTAFRPDPPHENFPGTDEAYHRLARQRWRRDVHMSVPGAWKAEVLQELEVVSERPPEHTDDAWRLVWAIGHARALAASEPDVVGPLQLAEAHLERHRRHVERSLSGQLRVEPLLAGLEASLQAGQPDEAQDRLLALEDVLGVAEVLGFAPHVQRILAEVARQVGHAPPTLAGFDELARQRLHASGQAAHTLWNSVLAAASRVPVSRPPAFLGNWFVRLDQLRALLVRGATGLLERFDVGAPILTPDVTLGRYSPEFRVHVEGHCPPEWRLRLFIVDAAHPDGEPLREDEHFHREADRWILDSWSLDDAEDVALVIALAAPSLPMVSSLAPLLDATASHPGVQVAEVLLSPPSGRMP